MYRVSKIFLLVHPNYDVFYSISADDFRNESDYESELRKGWNQLANEISADPSSLLICFSAINSFPIGEVIQRNINNDHVLKLVNRYLAEENKRNAYYRELLGDRFILQDGRKLPDIETLYEIFEKREIYFSNRISLSSCGEYYDICVLNWLVHLTNKFRDLGIEISSSRRIRELSYHDIDEVNLETLRYFKNNTGL